MAIRQQLDPHNPTPLWAQLTTVLRERLGEGSYFDRFPTEMELTVEFEVSRATVREAIRKLKDEGLLDARRGSGTFVVRRQLEQGLLGSPSLARAITAAGLEEESTVLRFSAGEAGDEAGRILEIAEGQPVVWLERVRTASGRPLVLDRSAIALDQGARHKLLLADLERGSLYDALADRCGVQVTGATEQVRAVTCSSAERELLELADSEGVLEVERVAFAGSVPVEWRRSLLRGDSYLLSASWGVVPPERLSS